MNVGRRWGERLIKWESKRPKLVSITYDDKIFVCFYFYFFFDLFIFFSFNLFVYLSFVDCWFFSFLILGSRNVMRYNFSRTHIKLFYYYCEFIRNFSHSIFAIEHFTLNLTWALNWEWLKKKSNNKKKYGENYPILIQWWRVGKKIIKLILSVRCFCCCFVNSDNAHQNTIFLFVFFFLVFSFFFQL